MNLREHLEKLTKWRAVFAGWQLGTRLEDDGEVRALKDHRELSILLRAELTAVTGLLIKKGVFSEAEFSEELDREAQNLDRDYARRFPGYESALDGMHITDLQRAAETMKKLGFPP